MGSRRLYDYVDDNPSVGHVSVSYVNDPYVVGQNDNLVSINSCIQVDLMGQIASRRWEANEFQISGTGGQVDFVRGAKLEQRRTVYGNPFYGVKGSGFQDRAPS